MNPVKNNQIKKTTTCKDVTGFIHTFNMLLSQKEKIIENCLYMGDKAIISQINTSVL